MKMNIFVYGSLMDREIMNHVSGSDPFGKSAVLHDFGRYKIEDAHYPGMLKEQGNRVEGLLYFDVVPDAVYRLDIFEGEMYSREEVDVRLKENNDMHKAMTYVLKDEYRYVLSSSGWSFEEFLVSGKRLFIAAYKGFEDLRHPMDAKQ
jgi:gamma-glutamylcyclotransferase (GGCT)/AIG2-like uncharacterized protein YtfP